MARLYIRPHISLHTYGEGDTPPAIVIHSVPLEGLDTVAHRVAFVVAGETVATVSLFSDVNAPLLVTQIDERPGAEDVVAKLAKERE